MTGLLPRRLHVFALLSGGSSVRVMYFALLPIWCPWLHLELISMRSKRFLGVWEQRKTEERDFRCFARAKNGARVKKRKRGRRSGRKEPSEESPTLERLVAKNTLP